MRLRPAGRSPAVSESPKRHHLDRLGGRSRRRLRLGHSCHQQSQKINTTTCAKFTSRPSTATAECQYDRTMDSLIETSSLAGATRTP